MLLQLLHPLLLRQPLLFVSFCLLLQVFHHPISEDVFFKLLLRTLDGHLRQVYPFELMIRQKNRYRSLQKLYPPVEIVDVQHLVGEIVDLDLFLCYLPLGGPCQLS